MRVGIPELVAAGVVLLFVAAGLAFALSKIKSVPLRVFIFVASCAAVVTTGLVQLGTPRSGSPDSAGAPPARFGLFVSSPQVLVDEDVVLGAAESQIRGLTLSEAHSIQVVAEGKAPADRSFSLYVMTASEYGDHFSKKKPFQHVGSFDGNKVRSFAHTETLPGGTWYVVLQNSEGGVRPTVVHLKVVSDPS
ncbi:MAG: hypothetical protein ABSC94_24065 [Polyangiaceae bacterium]|jgi:hypothetical protein